MKIYSMIELQESVIRWQICKYICEHECVYLVTYNLRTSLDISVLKFSILINFQKHTIEIFIWLLWNVLHTHSLRIALILNGY